MPPGTGDVALTVFQSLPLDGIIIVTSPQDLVSMIVSKAVEMAKMMNIPILGLVENYSYIQCGNCGEKISVFGKSHIDEISAKFGLPVLAKLPLDSKIAEAIDAGAVESLQGEWMEEAAAIIENVLSLEETEAETPKNIKIAVTTDENKTVYGHFGSAELFTVYTLEDGKLVEKKELANAGDGHTNTVENLVKEGVSVVICGGLATAHQDMILPLLKGYLADGPRDYRLSICKNTMADGALYLAGMPGKD